MEVPSLRAYINDKMVYFGKSGHLVNIMAFSDDNWVYLLHDQMSDEVVTWESMYVSSKKDDDTVKIMICSDFKDKYDNYIWEDDIVASCKDTREFGIVHFSIQNGIQIIGVETNTPWDYLSPEGVYNLEHLEVYGNIHENKDLLKRKLYE